MRPCLLFGLVACSQTLPPSPSRIELVPQAVGKAPHAAFSIVPADLGDDAEVAKIRHRVRVRWMHDAAFRHDDSMEPVIARRASHEIDRIYPVIGESDTFVRVVVENDDARVALWIARSDTWQTPLVPITLGDRDGRAPKSAGAVLSPGAPIDVAFGRDRVRHVTLRDPALVVEGYVPEAVLGNVWLVEPAEKSSDGRPITKFVERAVVRAAPDDDAPIVAIVLDSIRGFVNARGEWNDLELVRPYARIRGFIRARDLKPDDDALGDIATTGGTGFGMSHSDRLAVPAGACLFDKADGDVVGVAIKAAVRHGERDVGIAGWSRVYVDSSWAVLGYFVHDIASDSKQPVWESCAKH